jgi:hypothetical protein
VNPPLASVVDGEALLDVVWVSVAAGIGVTVVFAIAIVGATRAVELSRDGHRVEAIAFGAVAAAALVAVAAAVVLGIVAMTDK